MYIKRQRFLFTKTKRKQIPSSVDLENMFAKSGEDIGKPDENSNPKTVRQSILLF